MADRRLLDLLELRIMIACLAIATVSLLLPFDMYIDAWHWLLWGRQIVHLDLETAAGASWKPLPAAVMAVLSITGDTAGELWAIIVRTAWLVSFVLAYRLGTRIGGRAAGVFAGAAMLTLVGWLSDFTQPSSEPLAVALLLAAIESHFNDRPTLAFAFGFLVALIRPESWPLLAGYGLITWREAPRARPWIAASLAAVPLLWFGVDWLGSGDPLTGASTARNAHGHLRVPAITDVVTVLALPLWVLALTGVGFRLGGWESRSGRHEQISYRVDAQRLRATLILAGIAGAWISIAAAMAVFGFIGLPRYVLPAAVLVCILSGVGASLLFGAVPADRRVLVVGVLAFGSLPFLVTPARDIGHFIRADLRHAESSRDLRTVVADAGRRDRLLGCGRVMLAGEGGYGELPQLAYELDVPASRIDRDFRLSERELQPGIVVATGEARALLRRLAGSPLASGLHSPPVALAERGDWSVIALDC